MNWELEQDDALDGRLAAEARAQAFAAFAGLGLRYDNVVVCPAFDERIKTVERMLASVPGNALTILVVNGAEQAPIEAHARNLALLTHLGGENLGRHDLTLARGNVAILDYATTDRRPRTFGGVGFARRVGASLACALHDQGIVRSRWIHNLDADAQLDPRAFEVACEHDRDALDLLIYLPVYEIPAGDDPIPARGIELSGRIGVMGLDWAASPYALEPGSPMLAFDAKAYERAGGWISAKGGEDTDLANRILRTGTGLRLGTPVRIEARRSHRTRGMGDMINRASGPITRPLQAPHPIAAWECLAAFIDTIDHRNSDLLRKKKDNNDVLFAYALKRYGAALMHANPHVAFDLLETIDFVGDPRFDDGSRLPLHEHLKHPAWAGAGVDASDDVVTACEKMSAYYAKVYPGVRIGAPTRERK